MKGLFSEVLFKVCVQEQAVVNLAFPLGSSLLAKGELLVHVDCGEGLQLKVVTSGMEGEKNLCSYGGLLLA